MKTFLALIVLAASLFAIDSLTTPTPQSNGALTYTLTAIDTSQIVQSITVLKNGDVVVSINPQLNTMFSADSANPCSWNNILFRYANMGAGMHTLDSTFLASIILKTKNRLSVGLK